MKTKTVIKILIDVVMAVLYLLLMFNYAASPFFHEIVGIGIGLLFIIHVVLNWSWFRATLRLIKSGNSSFKKKFMVTLDFLMPIFMLITIITGVIIARTLFFFDIGSDRTILFRIHNLSSYICLGILAMHLLLHTKYLISVVKNIFKKYREPVVSRTVLGFCVVLLCFVMSYSFAYSKVMGNNLGGMAEGSQEKQYEDNSSNYVDDDSQNSGKGHGKCNGIKACDESDDNTSDLDNTSGLDDNNSDSSSDLTKYLSSLFCTECSKGCSLLNPQCAIGVEKAEQAKIEFYQQSQQ